MATPEARAKAAAIAQAEVQEAANHLARILGIEEPDVSPRHKDPSYVPTLRNQAVTAFLLTLSDAVVAAGKDEDGRTLVTFDFAVSPEGVEAEDGSDGEAVPSDTPSGEPVAQQMTPEEALALAKEQAGYDSMEPSEKRAWTMAYKQSLEAQPNPSENPEGEGEEPPVEPQDDPGQPEQGDGTQEPDEDSLIVSGPVTAPE